MLCCVPKYSSQPEINPQLPFPFCEQANMVTDHAILALQRLKTVPSEIFCVAYCTLAFIVRFEENQKPQHGHFVDDHDNVVQDGATMAFGSAVHCLPPLPLPWCHPLLRHR